MHCLDLLCLNRFKDTRKDGRCSEAGGRMIIIRSRRCERLLASAAGRASRVHWRNPAAAVFPTDVNNQIRLHPADMIAAGGGTFPRWCLTFGRMCLHHVLLQAALLNERLATTWLFANVHACRVPGVLLHVVEHRILAGLDFSTFGTDKSTFCIANVSHLRSDCLGVSHLRLVWRRRLRFTFFVPRRPPFTRPGFTKFGMFAAAKLSIFSFNSLRRGKSL